MATNGSGSGPAAVYVRISEDRGDEHLGVDRQERECRKLAAQLGWKVGEVYRDNDLSAFKAVRRPNYERLIADIEAGRWQRLLLVHSDRLYRRTAELERLIPILEGVEIRTVRAGDVDLSTATGRMTAKIVGATNQHESERTGERIRAKMAELVNNGAWKGGPRPFGWTGDGVTEVPAEVALLREARDRVFQGDSLRSICMDWQERGIRSARGREIQPTTLRKMLTSNRLVGRYAHRNGTLIGKGQWAAIMSEEDWAHLRVILLDTSRNTRGRREARTYLLTGGLLVCGLCGSRMFGRPAFGGRPTPYYGCKKATGYPGCGQVHARMPWVDELVERSVVERLSSTEFAKRRKRMLTNAPDLAEAVAELTAVQDRITELAATYGEGAITKGEWLTAKRRLEPRIEAAQRTLDSAQNDLGLAAATLDAAELVSDWAELAIARRRAVIRLLVERVEVHPHRGPVRHADPDRVKIVWRL
jgi:site-specific DNA recombinase